MFKIQHLYISLAILAIILTPVFAQTFSMQPQAPASKQETTDPRKALSASEFSQKVQSRGKQVRQQIMQNAETNAPPLPKGISPPTKEIPTLTPEQMQSFKKPGNPPPTVIPPINKQQSVQATEESPVESPYPSKRPSTGSAPVVNPAATPTDVYTGFPAGSSSQQGGSDQGSGGWNIHY